jgi:hypothetical protein
MADLTGTTPANTYKSLLQIGDATNGVDATAKYIEDGEGTDSALAISTDKVGIGTDSPSSDLHVASRSPTIRLENSTVIGGDAYSLITCSVTGNMTFSADPDNIRSSSDFRFNVDGTERMRIDSDGNVGIGATSPDAKLEVRGDIFVSNSNDTSTLSKIRILGTSTASGDGHILFQNNASTGSRNFYIGNDYTGSSTIPNGLSIKSSNHNIIDWAGTTNTLLHITEVGNVTPGTDDAQDFGSSTKRWDDIYATNATIQTSDRELKQDIEELTEAEERVAVACKGLLRKYRWKSSVEEKGDDARIHFGIMAQDLEAAFAAEGLDAGRYGMFIKNTWWEADRVIPAVGDQEEQTVLDVFDNIEDAPEGATEVTQRGVRYAELLAFIIAAI